MTPLDVWQQMLRMAVEQLRRTGGWPTVGQLDHRVVRELGGADLTKLIGATPARYMFVDSMDVRGRSDCAVALTHATVAEFGRPDLIGTLVRALDELAEQEARVTDEDEQLTATSDDLLDALGITEEADAHRETALHASRCDGCNTTDKRQYRRVDRHRVI